MNFKKYVFLLAGFAAWLLPIGQAQSENIFLGLESGFSYVGCSGDWNVGIGDGTFHSLCSGENNVAIGRASQYLMEGGHGNNCIGSSSCRFMNICAVNNNAFGTDALYSTTSGKENVVGGYDALHNTTTGSYNTAFGHMVGYMDNSPNANVAGSYNSWFGYKAGPGVPEQLTNATGIGNGARNTKSNQVVLGNDQVNETILNGTLKGFDGIELPDGTELVQLVLALQQQLSVLQNKLDAYGLPQSEDDNAKDY